MKKLIILLTFTSIVSAGSTYYKKGKLVELQRINVARSIDTNYNRKHLKFFRTQNGKKIGVTDEILVKCKDGVNCKEFLSQLNLKDILKLSSTIFEIKVDNNDNVFSVSRELYETGKVKFAHPNFVKKKRLR